MPRLPETPREVPVFLTLVTVSAAMGGAHRFPAETDVPDLSRSQAWARRLAGATEILCSPAEAAKACLKAAGLDHAVVDPLLRDRHNGAWAGQPIEAIAAAERDLFAHWLNDPEAAPAGGESVNALIERMQTWLGARERDRDNVLAITHPAVVRACLAAVLASSTAWFALDVSHDTRTVLTLNNSRWRIKCVNAAL